MLQVCFFCFAFHWIRVRTHLICQPDEKVWYYTWSVPPCPDKVLNGDNLATTMWPHSDWAGVRPGHTSAQLFASEAGSQEASHSLNSWLVHPRATVPAPWMAGWCPKPEAGLCQQAAESSAAPDHCSWVLGGNGGPRVTLRKGGQASHALCSFTTHLRNESSLKADCVLSSPMITACITPPYRSTVGFAPSITWSLWRAGGNSAECQRHWYHAKACCKTYGDLKEAVGITFTGAPNWRDLSGHHISPASTIPGSHNPFLWRQAFFCPAVVIVMLFQNLTALRVIISILNVLTCDL